MRIAERLRRVGSELRTLRWQWAYLLPAMLLWLAVIDVVYLALIWPAFDAFASGPIPKSRFIADYERRAQADSSLPRLRWKPVPLAGLPEHVTRAFIVAEDANFYTHAGVDLDAVSKAIDYNLERGRVVLGASTISQQTAKNLYLSRRRSLLRKWHELVLTWSMERHLSKRRILAIYLNTAELGRGIFGVEAAARAYWGKGASDLSVREAAALAASLPSPTRHNPATETDVFARRRSKVVQFMAAVGWPPDALDVLESTAAQQAASAEHGIRERTGEEPGLARRSEPPVDGSPLEQGVSDDPAGGDDGPADAGNGPADAGNGPADAGDTPGGTRAGEGGGDAAFNANGSIVLPACSHAGLTNDEPGVAELPTTLDLGSG